MTEIAIIHLYRQQRGKKFKAILTVPDTPRRQLGPHTSEELIDAVVGLLIDLTKAGNWKPGDRGRPPGGSDIARRLMK